MGARIEICIICDECGLKRTHTFGGDVDILDKKHYAADFGFDTISDQNKEYALCSEKCLNALAKRKKWHLSGPWVGQVTTNN